MQRERHSLSSTTSEKMTQSSEGNNPVCRGNSVSQYVFTCNRNRNNNKRKTNKNLNSNPHNMQVQIKQKRPTKRRKYDNYFQSNKICDYMRMRNKEENYAVEESYGDPYTTKFEETIRLWYTNPCGIGIDSTSLKSDDSFYFLRNKSKCDVFGLAETNVHWKLLYGKSSLYSRTKQRWKYFKTSTSHNKHMKLGKTQRGGTCTVAIGQTAHRVCSSGEDNEGMGRWSWIEFHGKDKHRTRVYTAYRPGGKPTNNSELTTVYHQQQNYLRQQSINKEPRDYFDETLQKELRQQIQQCNIVLMIDVNQDVINGQFTRMMNEIGMNNAFNDPNYETMPPTHHRGRRPISAIYLSPLLNVKRKGILQKGLGVHGDHRNMFVDISTQSFLGSTMYKVVSAPMKRLQMHDSRIVQKFLKHAKRHLESNNIYKISEELMQNLQYPIQSAGINQLENIDEQLGRAIEIGKKKCRKLRTGAIPFSDLFVELRDEQRLWKLVRKKKLGQRISNTTIRRLAKRLQIRKPMSFTLQVVTQNKIDAEKRYKAMTKQKARDGRAKFNEELAAANAANLNQPKTKILARIIQAESQREQHGITRKYFPKRGAGNKQVDRVQYQKDDTWEEAYQPREVMQACQHDTQSKYNETGNTPLMHPDMNRFFGNFSETPYAQDYHYRQAPCPPNSSQ